MFGVQKWGCRANQEKWSRITRKGRRALWCWRGCFDYGAVMSCHEFMGNPIQPPNATCSHRELAGPIRGLLIIKHHIRLNFPGWGLALEGVGTLHIPINEWSYSKSQMPNSPIPPKWFKVNPTISGWALIYVSPSEKKRLHGCPQITSTKNTPHIPSKGLSLCCSSPLAEFFSLLF